MRSHSIMKVIIVAILVLAYLGFSFKFPNKDNPFSSILAGLALIESWIIYDYELRLK